MSRNIRAANFKQNSKCRLAPRLSHDLIQQQTCDAPTAVIDVDGDIMDIDRARQKPKKDVPDYSPVDFGEGRSGAGDLKFLEEKIGAPGKTIRHPLDQHDFIQIGRGHRSKPHTLAGRKRATGDLSILWL